MPDRLIRDELLESGRWLDLPSDTDRLVFVGLLFRADDFGNLEGGQKRIFRFMQSFAQVRSEENAATVMLHLAEADLCRRYDVTGREFYHLPRTRPHRKYLVRKCPASPWCDASAMLGKNQRVLNQGHAKNMHDTVHTHDMHMPQGVVVGVGVGVGENPKSSSADKPVDKSAAKPPTWAEHWTAKGKSLGINPHTGESEKAYCNRIIRHCKA